MKKLLTMILGLAMLSGSAMASNVAYKVAPVVNVATFEDADTTTGVGLKGSAENVLVDKSVLSAGVNFYDLGGADLYRVPLTVGYVVKVNEDITVTPNVGVDVNILDVDGQNADGSIGFTTGAEVAYKVTENLNLVTGVAYSADTVEGTNLDGFTFTGGAKYQF